MKGLNDRMVTAYFGYIVDIAVLFGASKDKAMNELKESLKFEINLATVSANYNTLLSLLLPTVLP